MATKSETTWSTVVEAKKGLRQHLGRLSWLKVVTASYDAQGYHLLVKVRRIDAEVRAAVGETFQGVRVKTELG